MPHSMRKDGTPSKGSIYLWTAGFFPGTLWYLSNYTGDKALQDSALVYTHQMEPAKTFTDNHDIGFMMYCSYGNANRFAPKDEYEDILVDRHVHSVHVSALKQKSFNHGMDFAVGTVTKYMIFLLSSTI